MRPYYVSWLTSNHSSVRCVDCHYQPGLVGHINGKITGLIQFYEYETGSEAYTRLRAEVSDENCLQCHPEQSLPNVTFQGRSFSHQEHLSKPVRGIKLACTSCHSMIVIGMIAHTFAVSDPTCISCHPTLSAEVIPHIVVTTSTCFTCHFRNVPGNASISGCPSCHGPPTGVTDFNDVNFDHAPHLQAKIDCTAYHINISTGADAVVTREKCFECHNVPQRLQKYDDFAFIHGNHVTTHKIACYFCHSRVEHSPTVKENLCANCHKNPHPGDWITTHRTAVLTGPACASCHPPRFCANCHANAERMRR
ncbi:MAG TPA: cytochrome c3 family protein [Candidatus Methanoperedens sp.]